MYDPFRIRSDILVIDNQGGAFMLRVRSRTPEHFFDSHGVKYLHRRGSKETVVHSEFAPSKPKGWRAVAEPWGEDSLARLLAVRDDTARKQSLTSLRDVADELLATLTGADPDDLAPVSPRLLSLIEQLREHGSVMAGALQRPLHV